MQVRIYEHPFNTLRIDFVGELPCSPNRNKWILTAVCLFSNYLVANPVRDKTATTAARAAFDNVFLMFGFPSKLMSNRCGEWLNAVLDRVLKLLSIEHILTTSYRPRLNGSTERTHRYLNSALGIYCEKYQHLLEDYLQPAVYSHNVTPIPGTHDLSPFFLNFGRHSPSPEVIILDLPPQQISRNQYATHLVSRLSTGRKHLQEIKSDLPRLQRENYDSVSGNLEIPIGKIVYVRKPPASSDRGKATCFRRNYDGPYLVIGHSNNRPNLLRSEHQCTKEILPVINIEKVVVADPPSTFQIPNTAVVDSKEDVPILYNLYHTQDLLLLHFTLVIICCNVLIITLWCRKPVSLYIRSILQSETFSVAIDV